MATSPLLDDVLPAADASPALTDTQRVATGIGQSLAGPLNIARGIVGIGLSIAGTVFSAIASLVQSALKVTLARKIVDTVRGSDGAPSPEPEPAPSSRGGVRKPLLIALVVGLVLAVGGVAFKLLRTPSAPPVAPEPPRVRPGSGATGDSAPIESDELDALEVVDEPIIDVVEEDPRKRGE